MADIHRVHAMEIEGGTYRLPDGSRCEVVVSYDYNPPREDTIVVRIIPEGDTWMEDPERDFFPVRCVPPSTLARETA